MRRASVHQGELISATSAIVLLVLMFATKWFGLAQTPRPSATRAAISTAENAWHALPVVRWVMLLTIFVALGSVMVRAQQSSHGTKTDTGPVVAALGALTAALLAYRVLIDLPSPREVVDQKLGAYLGLLAAIGIALGGYEAMREERARVRALKHRARPVSGSS
jgi:hypothetical protein